MSQELVHGGSHGQGTAVPKDSLNLSFNEHTELAPHVAPQLLPHPAMWEAAPPNPVTQPDLAPFKEDKRPQMTSGSASVPVTQSKSSCKNCQGRERSGSC